jgi:hypothetical protein
LQVRAGRFSHFVSVVGDGDVVTFATQARREHVAVHLVVDEQ